MGLGTARVVVAQMVSSDPSWFRHGMVQAIMAAHEVLHEEFPYPTQEAPQTSEQTSTGEEDLGTYLQRNSHTVEEMARLHLITDLKITQDNVVSSLSKRLEGGNPQAKGHGTHSRETCLSRESVPC